MRAHI